MITHGLRKGQLDDLLERVNTILLQNNLSSTTKPNISYHLRNLNKPSQTLTGEIIKREARKMAAENEAQIQEATNMEGLQGRDAA